MSADTINVNLKIRYSILVFVTLLSIGAGCAYYFTATTPETTIILAIIGACIAIGTLLYTAISLSIIVNHNVKSRELAEEHHKEILTHEKDLHDKALAMEEKNHQDIYDLTKREYASNLISEWNHPDMVPILTVAYKVRNSVVGMDGKGVEVYLKENPEQHGALVCVFNYFEKIAHMIEHDVVDHLLLKDYFGELIKVYYHSFRGFIDFKQDEMKSKEVLNKFIWLAESWNKANK